MFDFSSLFYQFARTKKTMYALNSVLFLALALSATYWTKFYMDQRYQTLLGASITSEPQATGVGINADDLVSFHLFGNSEAAPSTQQQNIPLSSLNLKLTGVVASDRGGFALISVNGQPQAPFFIGEVVAENAILDSVMPDRVILLRGSSKESLLLDADDSTSLPVPAFGPPQPAPGHVAIPAGSIQNIGNNAYSVPRKVVADNVNNVDLLQQALVVPNKDGGFLVKSIQPGSVFGKLGLRQGDVIRKVNNMPVNSMVDVAQLYRLTGDINRIDNIRVELDRNGSQQTLQYNLH